MPPKDPSLGEVDSTGGLWISRARLFLFQAC